MSYGKSILIGLTFFGLIVSIALTTYYLSLGSCPSGYLTCDEGGSCIPEKLVCNFVKDCKDGQDENGTVCGNFYGSTYIEDVVFKEGIQKMLEKQKKYNYSVENSDINTCLFSEEQIPLNCVCKHLYLIVCKNVTEIPLNFPTEVVMIDLALNGISLNETATFGSYKNLTFLDLRNNSISHIHQGFLSDTKQLRKLFLQFNRISSLPSDFCESLRHLLRLWLNNNLLHDFDLHKTLGCMKELQFLELANNQLTLEGHHFPFLPSLKELFIDENYIEIINDKHFNELLNLTLISLRKNKIRYITKSVFHKLHGLKEIVLSGNPILYIQDEMFGHFRFLDALYLDNLHINISDKLLSSVNVSFLSLRGISYKSINFETLQRMGNLKHVVYEKFIYCSNTPRVKKCFPKIGTDGLSSTSDILEKKTLRYAVWIMALLTFFGNASVLWKRFRDENRNVSIVIRNLAFSDMIMGVYLTLIAYMDAYYRDSYHENSEWVKSWECVFIGILAMTSSEVSILILTFMSIERFLLISDPFGHRKIDTKNVILSLYIIWILGLFIAIFPVILFHSSTKFYTIYNGPTCFPLFIDEVFVTGWIYSAFVFLGINFTLLILIATLYTALIISIYRTRRATSLNFFDCEFAVRFFFIVLTDASCWAPIIVLKLLAFYKIEVSGDISAWLIIFVLPLNAAVNPFLFTYTTPKYRDKLFNALTIKRPSLKKQDVNSNQNTAEDSQTKVSLLYTSNGSISKWKIFNK